MSFATPTITRGRIVSPDRILITGMPGVGKTTWAAGAPSPLFLDLERGSHQHDIARMVPTGWGEMLRAIDDFPADQGFRTLVIDSLSEAEASMWREISEHKGALTVGDVEFGKGYLAAEAEWGKFFSALDRLQAKQGVEVIGIGHLVVRTATNPTGADFSRYDLAVYHKHAPLIYRWFETVGFADSEHVVNRDEKISYTGKRVLRLARRSGFEAKSRYRGLDTLPLEYAAYAEAREKTREKTAGDLYAEAAAMLAQLNGHPEAQGIAADLEKAKGDQVRLTRAIEYLRGQLLKPVFATATATKE
jgi:hypothetical protein